jgi:hypothetical protein
MSGDLKLPVARRDSCAGDYSNAAYSWDLVLKPHRRSPDQPQTEIEMLYGPAEGRAKIAQQAARDIRLLQTVGEHVASDFVWPKPLSLEMQSCGFPTPGGILRPTSLRCVTNSLPNSQTSIAIMAARTRARELRTARSERRSAQWHLNRPASTRGRYRTGDLGHLDLPEPHHGAGARSPAGRSAPAARRTSISPASRCRTF